MAHTTVRITETTRDLLKGLAAKEGRPMQSVLETALRDYERKALLETVNAGWDRVREQEGEWQTTRGETNTVEGTLADGMPQGEVWTLDGEEISTDGSDK